MVYLLGLAFILRLILLNQSLWLDEAIQALALMGQMGPLLTYALADFQPPLYHGLLALWTQLFGYTELALRTPSLLSGVSTVYFVAKLGDLLGGKKLGLLAGYLAATSPLLIYYSQEGRTYGLTTFFVTAAMYYLIRSFNQTHNQRPTLNLVSYTLFSILFLWTSYLTWFLHLAVFLYTLFQKRRELIFAQLLSAATLIFWLPSLFSSLWIGLSTLNGSPAWANVVGAISVKALVLTWVKTNLGRISFDNNYLYGAVVLALFLLHARIFATSKLKSLLSSAPSRPLLIWLGSVLLIALFSLVLPVYSYTRVLFVVPSYLLLFSYALAKQPRLLTVSVIATQLLALVYFWSNPNFHREDWRQVVADYGQSATYALPSLAQNAPLRYYGVDSSRLYEPKLGVPPDTSPVVYLKYVEDIFDPQALGPQNLKAAGYTIIKESVYPGIQVYLYANNP